MREDTKAEDEDAAMELIAAFHSESPSSSPLLLSLLHSLLRPPILLPSSAHNNAAKSEALDGKSCVGYFWDYINAIGPSRFLL